MVSNDKSGLGLGESAAQFLAKLSSAEREISQPEVYRFVRWYGSEKPLAGLTAPEVASYAEQLSQSDTGYAKKLELIRAFLAYARKQGWSLTNLAAHLKTKHGKSGPQVASRRGQREPVSLTRQKHEELKTELAGLKVKSRELIEDIRRAAADKDFRENAPLAAAREQRGHVEGRIKELEETMKMVTIIGEKREPTLKTSVGDTVLVSDMESGEEVRYMIVDPREVDPSKGKISMASPLGKGLIGRSHGDVVEISAPAGKLRYQLKSIER